MDIGGANTFQQARTLIREHLAQTGTSQAIVKAVTALLLPAADDAG